MVFLKGLYIILSISLVYLFIGNIHTNKVEIPKEALRFRVIASSNSDVDQALKLKVKLQIERKLSEILKGVDSIDSANSVISSSVPVLKSVVEDVLNQENSMEAFKVNFGNNYFPEKEYNGIKYNEGDYNSLTITLGNGLGDNWWCILFPPLCLLDNNSYAPAQYRFYVKDLIDKYTS
jgi:stage II sporulation protein R